MPLKLEDLTKKELLTLCHRWCLNISERDIRMVRHESLYREARDLANQAQKEMKEATGDPSMEGRTRFLEAAEKFDKAMKMYDEAGKILEGKEIGDDKN